MFVVTIELWDCRLNKMQIGIVLHDPRINARTRKKTGKKKNEEESENGFVTNFTGDNGHRRSRNCSFTKTVSHVSLDR
jgi:hypothetical protein